MRTHLARVVVTWKNECSIVPVAVAPMMVADLRLAMSHHYRRTTSYADLTNLIRSGVDGTLREVLILGSAWRGRLEIRTVMFCKQMLQLELYCSHVVLYHTASVTAQDKV